VEDPVRAVIEMFRVLAPGGLALLIDPNHEQADIVTSDPAAWQAVSACSIGRVRHRRAGLHLAEWMAVAGFVDLVVTATALLWPWPAFRTLVGLDEGAERAIEASQLTRDRWDAFVAEQDERHRRGTSVNTAVGYRCLGSRPMLTSARRG
jgi:SAM-dependent methyltransferase